MGVQYAASVVSVTASVDYNGHAVFPAILPDVFQPLRGGAGGLRG